MGGELPSTQWSQTQTSPLARSLARGWSTTDRRTRSRVSAASSLAAFALGAILGAGLFPIGDPLRIQDAANDVVTHAGEVADAATTHQDNGVFLEVMPFPGNVRCHFRAVGKADARHFAQRGV